MQSPFHIISIVIAVILLINSDAASSQADDGLRLDLPRSHVAYGGDVHAELAGIDETALPTYYKIRLSRLDGSRVNRIAIIPLLSDPTRTSLAGPNVTRFAVPCGYFTKGGFYYVDILTDPDSSEPQNANLSRTLDVRWPVPQLSVSPEVIETFPDSPVTALLEFPEVICDGPPPTGVSAPTPEAAKFWLELLYCGHDMGEMVMCDGRNKTSRAHVLSSQQVYGFPGKKIIKYRCDLFGMPGDYALILKPATPSGSASALDHNKKYVKAYRSKQYVLNIHARSMLPCDESIGIRALFQYPSCILDNADRVRIFGRVRAAVASLAPPSTLHYVAEQRVIKGQHSLTFNCDLFSERFVEYCFVYVSQSITGAVADIRTGCVPTLPIKEDEAGAWGPWSKWSICPVRDGAAVCAASIRSRHRFCDSPPPRYGARFCEGESVETSTCANAPECTWLPILAIPTSVADTPEVVAEVGPGCRCGCVVHLSIARTARLVAGSTRACPGRSFWLIQADVGHAVRLSSAIIGLPCSAQKLRARDGDTLGGTMLAEWVGGRKQQSSTPPPAEAEEVITSDRFLLLEMFSDELAAGSDSCVGGFTAKVQQTERNTTSAGSDGITAQAVTGGGRSGSGPAMVAVAVAVGAAVAAVALAIHSAVRTRHYRRARGNDTDELTDSDACSASMAWFEAADGEAGAVKGSRSTLLSEIVEVVSMRKLRRGHARLKESEPLDSEICAEVHTQCDGYASDASSITLHNTPIPGAKDQNTKDSKPVSAPETPTNNSPTPSPLRRSKTTGEGNKSVGIVNDTGATKFENKQPIISRSNNMVSSVTSEASTVAIDLSESISSGTDKELDSISEREIDSVGDKDCIKEKGTFLTPSRSSSVATLTNGCYSPALSTISTAKVRLTNSKETKEQKNRRRLLKGGGPGSEFSLGTQEELEIDYYDYEVNNAGTVPGSYLGMDPAFLVWIPPIDEGSDDLCVGESKDHHLYEEILPRDSMIDPGSNTESPDFDAPPLPQPRTTDPKKKELSTLDKALKSTIIHPLNFTSSDSLTKDSPDFDRKILNQRRDTEVEKSAICIPMDILNNASKAPYLNAKPSSGMSEKQLVDVSDIQFADEDSDESKSEPVDGDANKQMTLK